MSLNSNKFYRDGRVRTFPGNTIVCHLAALTPLIERIDKLYERLVNAEAALNYTLLPPSSWHMTVLDGVCDKERWAERWPEHFDRRLSLSEIHESFESRLKAERFGPKLTFAMRVEGFWPLHKIMAIQLTPADDKEAQAIRNLRLRLSHTLGFACSNPDTYSFHISLAYLIKRCSGRQMTQLKELLAEEAREISKSLDFIPAIENTTGATLSRICRCRL
jgi:hypothetical protein